MSENVKLISKILDRTSEDYQKRINQVFKLRYKEMIREYNPNAPLDGIDFDEYDKYCDHLVVIDEITDEVVGTYRLIKREHVKSLNDKFLLEEEFDISGLKNRKVLEVGRACVASDYRSGGVIMMLWKGSLQYAIANGMDFMVGTASFHGTDVEPYRKQLAYLTKKYLSTEKAFAINNVYDILNDKIEFNEDEEFKNLPPLVKGYLRMGSKIGQNAYIDYDFCSVDVLIITDIENMDPRYKQRFSK